MAINGSFSARCALAMGVWAIASALPLSAVAERIGIAAIVNDDVITTTEVSERRSLIMATSGVPDTEENRAKMTPRITQSLIDEALQLQEAKRQSLSVTDDEVNKAIDALAPARGQPAGTLKQSIAAKGLSTRSLENQIRAQLAWTKFVQRKLRRNVTITQDEVLRAQQSQAAAPGATELKIAVLSVPIKRAEDEAAGIKLGDTIAAAFKSGAAMPEIAAQYAGQSQVQFTPPAWVPEDNLQPALQQALRGIQPGAVTPPIRSGGGIQFVSLLDRKTIKKQSDATEIALKQILVPAPTKRDKASLEALKSTAAALRKNPGNCDDEKLPPTALPAQVKFARTQVGLLSPEQRSIIAQLEVGGVSEPILTPDALRLVMLCEKIEPSSGYLPDAVEVRQKLFAEKIELEAQKQLRNLRRDAFISIKDTP